MFERTCIRVLSPSSEPPVLDEEGSTASTASLPSFAIILCPKFGVDLLTTVIKFEKNLTQIKCQTQTCPYSR